MTRAQAVEKAAKLERLARRTRHAGERQAAREALLRLASRHGLSPDEWTEPSPEPRRWTAPRRGAAEVWYFDPATGSASANVEVRAWRDRNNWRIEVPHDALYGGNREAVRRIRERDPRLPKP